MIYQIKTYGKLEPASGYKNPTVMARLNDHIKDDLENTGLHEYMHKFQDLVTKFEILQVFDDGSALWDVTVTKILTTEEKKYLLEYVSGQCSDGWGEGYEQNPCCTIGSKEYYYSPWVSGKHPEFG